MRKQGAFYLMVGSVLVLALLITLRPDLNPTRWIPSAFASRGRTVLEGGIWMTYANGDAVQALAVQDDTLWVGTHLGGLVRWDISTKTYTQYLYPQTDLPSNDVRAVGIDRLGRIWVGTDRGLAVLSSDGSTIVAHHTGNSGLPADEVMDVRVGPDGRVWVATYGGGVAVLDDGGTTEDLSDDEWIIYDRSNGLLSPAVTALDLDEEGNVWIGTRSYPNPDPAGPPIWGGLCIFDGTSFSCYSKRRRMATRLVRHAARGQRQGWRSLDHLHRHGLWPGRRRRHQPLRGGLGSGLAGHSLRWGQRVRQLRLGRFRLH